MSKLPGIRQVLVLFGNEYPGDAVSGPPKEVLDALDALDVAFDAVNTNLPELLLYLQDRIPDVVLLTAQGPMGQWGAIQGLFDGLGIPYVGSPLEPTALAANKELTKRLCTSYGIRTPATYFIQQDIGEDSFREPVVQLSWPAIAKPVFGGGSHGITLARDRAALDLALDSARNFGCYLVEEYINGDGREYSAGVMETNGALVPLPVCEIVLDRRLFTHDIKFAASGYERYVPARVSVRDASAMQDIAIRVHRAFGCRGLSRTDMVRDRVGNLYVLEVNTLPGLLSGSIFPQECLEIGLTYEQMLARLLLEACAARRKIT